MQSRSLFLSPEGFDYLLEVVSSDASKENISLILDSLYVPRVSSPVKSSVLFRGANKAEQSRKIAQYQGLVSRISLMKPKRGIVEAGCGNGRLSELLAGNFDVPVFGVDKNEPLINSLHPKHGNLSYDSFDLMAAEPDFDFDLILGLHCCGSLSDRVVELGVQRRASVIAVPCCYGKINGGSPRSITLKRRDSDFRRALERTKSLEGYTDHRKNLRANVLLEAFRRLVDFDRIFYLQENGYDAFFEEITGKKVGVDRYHASPLRHAIIGIPIQ